MKTSIIKGLSFGLTSGVVTTLGLIVGLSSGTNSRLVVVGGVLVIAIADACSDALGVHLSEEVNESNSHKDAWDATFATFLSKLIFALTFLFPILFLELDMAVLVSIIWGLSLISIFSYYIAKQQKASPLHVICEHVFLTIAVVIITHYVGVWVNSFS